MCKGSVSDPGVAVIDRNAEIAIKIRIQARPRVRSGRPRAIPLVYRVAKTILAPVLKARMEIDALGLGNIPTSGAAILACNHRSGQDPQVVSIVVPRYIAWVAANYMSRVPIQGPFLRSLGVVFVPTLSGGGAAQFFERAKAVLSEGQLLGVFPEGDDYIFANDFSAPPARFHRGFAALALRNDTPIVPVAIYPVAERLAPIPISKSLRRQLRRRHDLSAVRSMPQYKSVRVTFGKPLRPSAIDITAENLADRVRSRISKMLQEHSPGTYLSRSEAPARQGDA